MEEPEGESCRAAGRERRARGEECEVGVELDESVDAERGRYLASIQCRSQYFPTRRVVYNQLPLRLSSTSTPPVNSLRPRFSLGPRMQQDHADHPVSAGFVRDRFIQQEMSWKNGIYSLLGRRSPR